MLQSQNKTILLVEDEAIIALMGKRLLTNAGYNVIHVLSGESAVETVQKDPASIKLILMDIDLGQGMDGTQAASEILKDHDIPLLFLSSHTEQEIVEKTEEITSYGYVVKGSGSTVLLASIKMAFKLYDAQKALRINEEARRKSDERFGSVYDTAPVGIAHIDPCGKIIDSNPAITYIFGYSSDEIQGIEWWKFTNPEDALLNSQIFSEVFSDGRTYHKAEKRFIHKNGSLIWILLTAVAIRDANGDVSYIQAIVEDITRRKLDEQKLLQSEQRFRSLVENAPVAISVSLDGKAVYSNKVFAEMLGYERPEEFIGMDITEHLAPEDRAEVLDYINKRMKGEPAPSVYEVKAIRKNGEIFNMLSRACSVQLAEGMASVAFLSDLTDLYKMTQNLRESEERLRLVVEGGNVGFWDLNMETGQAFRNKQWSDMLGLPGDDTQATFSQWIGLIHPDDREKIKNSVSEHLLDNLYIHDNEYRILTGDGSYKWIYDRGMVIKRDENGQAIRMCGIVMDITERKASEEKLKQYAEDLKISNAEKDKIFSILSHDLKGPFSGFLGLTKELAEEIDDLTRQEISDLAAVMHHSATEVYDLLTNLLDWSRLQAGRYQFENEEVELFIQAENLRSLFSPVSAGKSIYIKNNIPKDLTLITDKNALSTVLRNLIDNAIKFTNNDGTVILNASLNAGFVEISVADSGIGLSRDAFIKIFKTGTGYSTSGTIGEKGSGLGLIICKDFVSRLGGEIRAGNNDLGGTTFTFSLPVAI